MPTRFEVDHTPFDFMIVDETNAAVRRPRLTTVVESFSRMIVALHISLAAPDEDSKEVSEDLAD